MGFFHYRLVGRRCATSAGKSASATLRATEHRPLQLEGKYGGLSVSDFKRLQDPKAESACLKKICAAPSLVHDVQMDAVAKSSTPWREAHAGYAQERRTRREHPSGLPNRRPRLQHMPVHPLAEAGRRRDRCAKYTRRPTSGNRLLAVVSPPSVGRAPMES